MLQAREYRAEIGVLLGLVELGVQALVEPAEAVRALEEVNRPVADPGQPLVLGRTAWRKVVQVVAARL